MVAASKKEQESSCPKGQPLSCNQREREWIPTTTEHLCWQPKKKATKMRGLDMTWSMSNWPFDAQQFVVYEPVICVGKPSSTENELNFPKNHGPYVNNQLTPRGHACPHTLGRASQLFVYIWIDLTDPHFPACSISKSAMNSKFTEEGSGVPFCGLETTSAKKGATLLNS